MGEKLIFCAKNPAELEEVARAIIGRSADYKIWLFTGEMGAGKTTLIKEICQQLGVIDEVSSPTFSLVNEYLTAEEQTVYHFDFYRLEEEDEAMQIGVEEYFDSGDICMLEWPEKIENLLPDSFLRIDLTENLDLSRNIELSTYG